MKFAVLVFPGSAGAVDMYQALNDVLGQEVHYVRHDERDLSVYDVIVIPSGFSYGSYLRAGALARHAPIMKEVQKEAESGKPILGVGNGFQILLEAGLLPGAMLQNDHLQFRCLHTPVQVVNNNTMFTGEYEQGEVLSIPIAHGDGNYVCDESTLKELQDGQQIVFRYEENPDGSTDDIAGLVNRKGNVLGMMPHPERALEMLLGSADGKRLFTSIVAAWREKHVTV